MVQNNQVLQQINPSNHQKLIGEIALIKPSSFQGVFEQ